MKLRILLDLQGCQSASRFRGIGRYSLALAQAITRNAGPHEISLLLNGLFPETIGPLYRAFDGLVPRERITVFRAAGPVAEHDTGNSIRARSAEQVREAIIELLQPDVLHLTSLFEGFVDDAVTSIPGMERRYIASLTLYDLIPLLNPDPYLSNSVYRDYYFRKIDSLKRADLLLSISDSSRREVARAVGIAAPPTVNISSAADERFQLSKLDETNRRHVLERCGISKPFLLSAGLIEPRKNFEALVHAYARLSPQLRKKYQLVLICQASHDDRSRFAALAAELGLNPEDLLLLDHVTDQDLVALYNLCELFVFPSLHEGFGLPALEAMACGAAVIGSNTTSIPEVIGRQDALFDPRSPSDVARLMTQALTDCSFQQSLRDHALQQSRRFSWDATARRALCAFEDAARDAKTYGRAAQPTKPGTLPPLAMVTPVPPEQTGIAHYVAELLPSLSAHYEITLITDQPDVGLPPEARLCSVRSIAWFEQHADQFDRIIYQFGNSPFHAHMFRLLRRHPGVVVLHDFFLSSVLKWMEDTGYEADAFSNALFASHGYRALMQQAGRGSEYVKIEYPCCYDVACFATGVIVHSQFSRDLGNRFFGEGFSSGWHRIPHVRVLKTHQDRLAARARLGFNEEFVLCSFGFLAPTKLNLRLLQAWDRSLLADDPRCRLIFVGENEGAAYGAAIVERIKASRAGSRISITGYVSPSLFDEYLCAADVAVQLRCMSRGETAGTVLDCLAHGIPLLINAHGSMAELPDDALLKLPDEFTDEQLVAALNRLYLDPALRRNLSQQAIRHIAAHHDPSLVARQYCDSIESFTMTRQSRQYRRAVRMLPQANGGVFQPGLGDVLRQMHALRGARTKKRLLLDLSATVRNDLKTGIERAARALLMELLRSPPSGYDVEPVFLSKDGDSWRFRYARSYARRELGISQDLNDEPVVPQQGDILLALDLFPEGVCPAVAQGLYDYWRAIGAQVNFLVFDLLPVIRPDVFPPGAEAGHRDWLTAICRVSDGLVCISRSVADDLKEWIERNPATSNPALRITHSHLGSDITASLPTSGFPPEAGSVLEKLAARSTVLMVGTIEPRKGYLQALGAFDILRSRGRDLNLVIVGHEGWKPLPEEMRRTIPTIVSKLRTHPALGDRLFWLEGISDEYLEKIYGAADCLLAASEGEGFGLPLIEAARHDVSIVARDIAVFREVAGDSAYYFSGSTDEALADTLDNWLALRAFGDEPKPADRECLTWTESARNLLRFLLSNQKVPSTAG